MRFLGKDAELKIDGERIELPVGPDGMPPGDPPKNVPYKGTLFFEIPRPVGQVPTREERFLGMHRWIDVDP